jgi:hypothetical protein
MAAKSVDQRLPVVLAPERRVHLESGVEAPHGLVGERQVVRGGLAGDLDARILGAPDLLDRCAGGEMLHVDAGPLV